MDLRWDPQFRGVGFRFKFRAGLCAVFLGKILYFDSTYFYLGVNMSTGDMSVKFDEMLKWGRGQQSILKQTLPPVAHNEAASHPIFSFQSEHQGIFCG